MDLDEGLDSNSVGDAEELEEAEAFGEFDVALLSANDACEAWKARARVWRRRGRRTERWNGDARLAMEGCKPLDCTAN